MAPVAGELPAIEAVQETGRGLREVVGIPTCHVSSQFIVTYPESRAYLVYSNLYLDHARWNNNQWLIGGHVSEPDGAKETPDPRHDMRYTK